MARGWRPGPLLFGHECWIGVSQLLCKLGSTILLPARTIRMECLDLRSHSKVNSPAADPSQLIRLLALLPEWLASTYYLVANFCVGPTIVDAQLLVETFPPSSWVFAWKMICSRRIDGRWSMVCMTMVWCMTDDTHSTWPPSQYSGRERSFAKCFSNWWFATGKC